MNVCEIKKERGREREGEGERVRERPESRDMLSNRDLIQHADWQEKSLEAKLHQIQ